MYVRLCKVHKGNMEGVEGGGLRDESPLCC